MRFVSSIGCAWLGAIAAMAIGCGDAGNSDASDGSGGGSTSTSSSPSATSGTGGAPPIDPGCDGDPTQHSGDATYYDFADGSGNCSFPATPDDLMVGAMNHTDYADSAVCGACADVTGPNGTVHIRIVDQCPECPQGNIDLSPEAFAVISPLE
ncbi:MAG TPA: expansin EXLX1 family cellulose-binding protein, partial [Polyangiaceae bacterium]|nr:expansin EXLX1 family cellulose-binding protein [Polyangiaceae bacterium]